MTSPLPDVVVRKLNRLGFALIDGEQPYTFVRLAAWGELRLLVQALGSDSWRVGMASRAANEPGRLPNPLLSVDLSGLGASSDGLTLDVSTDEICERLPRLVREDVLPMWDFGPV